jgi:sugar phosphate isomerase/epimerase
VTLEYTGYLDFWFSDRPLVSRIAPFMDLGVKNMNFFFWRQAPVQELAAECKRLGARLYSTFDGDMGSLADPGDNEKTYHSWAESLEMAERYDIPVLYIFSNQIEAQDGVEYVRRAICQSARSDWTYYGTGATNQRRSARGMFEPVSLRGQGFSR